MNRRSFLESAILTSVYALGSKSIRSGAQSLPNQTSQPIVVRPDVESGALPHYWEECFGSDRAIVGMRQQWLSDLERTRKDAGMKSVRFHGLFDDEMGVWTRGSASPNFLYVDTVFDAMIERGVRPLVELSFMPGELASGTRTAFFYRGNVTTPTDMSQWHELVHALASHCIDRYGKQEVRNWNFEVWNEPNLSFFWAGTQAEYFELYRQAATALKSVDGSLRVGGPATAQAAWVPEFLEFCTSKQVPVDFVSSHIYPDDSQEKVFGKGVAYPFEQVIQQALLKLKSQIKASKLPNLPLYITEWSSQNPAFIVSTIKDNIGVADMMSFWTFDNIFEENGVPRSFMNRNFGLLGTGGIPRLSFHAFTLLHRLGDVQIACDEGPVLATRKKDGSLAILVWNLIPLPPGHRSSMGDPVTQVAVQDAEGGESKQVVLKLQGGHRFSKGHITRVDENHGGSRLAYQQMGSPQYPTMQQIDELRKKSDLPQAESIAPGPRGEFVVTLPPNGIALLELPSH